MAFTVQDFSDLTRLLAEHPEWQAELRRLLLAGDFMALPGIVRELVEAQGRTDETVRQLAEAQRRSEERLGKLEEAHRLLEIALERLAERVENLASIVHALVDDVRGLKNIVSDFKGKLKEMEYREKVGAFFGPLLRKVQAVDAVTLEDQLEAHLSYEEFKEVLLLDVLVRGRPRYLPEAPEVFLAVEVSSVVDREDVARAVRRAGLLRQAGYPTIPTVAGEKATLGAEEEARQHNVVVLQDGRAYLWEEALKAAVVE